MTQTVATPTDTDQPKTKPAADLKPGDWFIVPDSGREAAEVLSVHPARDDLTFVVYRTASDREPAGLRWNGNLPICGPDDVEKATSQARRFEVADQLEAFIRVLVGHDVPVPEYGTDIDFSLRTAADVDAVAAVLGIPAADQHGMYQVVWPIGAKYDAPFRARWFTYTPREPKPEPAAKPAEDTGLTYSRPGDGDASPAAVPAGVDGATLGKRGPKK